MKYFTFAIITLFLVGCKTYSEEDKTKFDQKIEKFIAKSEINFERSESGLYYHIENVGQGEFIKFNDEVSFTYTGKLRAEKHLMECTNVRQSPTKFPN